MLLAVGEEHQLRKGNSGSLFSTATEHVMYFPCCVCAAKVQIKSETARVYSYLTCKRCFAG